MTKIKGYILWYNEHSDDGVIQDMEGNAWYFNSYSFPKTHYKVTGKCKKTGRKKTIKTKHFPGLFLDYKLIKDPIVESLNRDIPVLFSAFESYDGLWALEIEKADHHKEILENKLESMLTYINFIELDPRFWYRNCWLKHCDKRFDKIIEKIWEHK